MPVFFRGRVSASASVGANYRDARHVDYFYGVRESESNAGRSAYRADAALDPWIGYSLRLGVTPRWNLVHTARMIDLDEAIVRSPPTTDVGREVQALLIASYTS